MTLHRVLALFCTALLLSSAAEARTRKGHRARPHEVKNFPANHESVRLENETADAMGAPRYLTQSEVDEAVHRGRLSAIYSQWTYVVAPKLPIERRYALPETVKFLSTLSREFRSEFKAPLMVDSAIRPASAQRRLLRWNRSAAPADGDRASSHERGTTIDISRRMTKAERRWMAFRLMYYRGIGRILVIEERACYHIFVKGEAQ